MPSCMECGSKELPRRTLVSGTSIHEMGGWKRKGHWVTIVIMLMHVYRGRAAGPPEVTKLKSFPTNLINWTFGLGEEFVTQYSIR